MRRTTSREKPPLPETTVMRLPGYLRALQAMRAIGVLTTSSGELADRAGVRPALLRRDLSHLGTFGTRGIGYHVDTLIGAIGGVVGNHLEWPVLVVGAGNLGQALARHRGLARRGFRLAGIIDVDPRLIGTRVGQVRVEPLSRLDEVVAACEPVIAVIATPVEAAQECADLLVASGLRRILTFAAVPLEVPDHVTVREVDLAREMQVLVYHELAHPGRAGSGKMSADLTRTAEH